MVIVTAMSAPSMMTTVATAAALLTVADGFKISGTVGGTDVDLKASTRSVMVDALLHISK